MAGLHALFADGAARHPSGVAVIEPGRASITYTGLNALTDRLRDRLAILGVSRGDRVGLFLHKSIDAVASLLGALKAGAAYVPVDPGAPVARGAFILQNCAVKVVLVETDLADRLEAELHALGATPVLIRIEPGAGGGAGLAAALAAAQADSPCPAARSVVNEPSDLAYILYTSGSTGKPKGVMLSHENAVSFVNWCSEIFEPRTDDRISSHAPFHFDLSILDIHLPPASE